MTARALPLYLFALALALAVFAACGGGGDGGERPAGRLTDPRTVATATPWAEPPEPIILEPGALTPISDGGDDGGDGEGTPTAPGECGDTYTVESGDVPFTIAEKCGVNVEDLLKANPEVTPTALRVGQQLKIP